MKQSSAYESMKEDDRMKWMERKTTPEGKKDQDRRAEDKRKEASFLKLTVAPLFPSAHFTN